MKRRDFIGLIVGAAAAWPFATRAQQPRPVIGFLSGSSLRPMVHSVAAFRQGLEEGGYVEGQNVAIEYRWAEEQYDGSPALAADLVDHHVTVIVTNADVVTLAAKAATSTIPIVFVSGSDPVRNGLVPSLNRPGGNVTGVTTFSNDLVPKRLGLLHELVPNAIVVALLADQNAPGAVSQVSEAQDAARSLGQQLLVLNARTASDIDTAFKTLVRERAVALVVGAGAFLTSRREQIVALAARHTIPAIYGNRESVADGGLISYGNSQSDAWRRAGVYTARILKGETPADLPVERSTKFELVINLKTAKALGITMSREFLLLADEVIE
jgi:putative ABC transport system substrate-binding protein